MNCQKKLNGYGSINLEETLARYRLDILVKAKETMSKEDLTYIEEDLRSPCTQEIAIFHVFASIVDKCDDEVVVIDIAPTGHTLLLLDATESYHKEIEHIKGDVAPISEKLIMKKGVFFLKREEHIKRKLH